MVTPTPSRSCRQLSRMPRPNGNDSSTRHPARLLLSSGVSMHASPKKMRMVSSLQVLADHSQFLSSRPQLGPTSMLWSSSLTSFISNLARSQTRSFSDSSDALLPWRRHINVSMRSLSTLWIGSCRQFRIRAGALRLHKRRKTWYTLDTSSSTRSSARRSKVVLKVPSSGLQAWSWIKGRSTWKIQMTSRPGRPWVPRDCQIASHVCWTYLDLQIQ